MLCTIRRITLLSFTALATLSLAPVAGDLALHGKAFAKDGGHESRGGEHSEGGGRGGDDHGGSDDSGSDDGAGDDSGSDDGAGDDHGRGKGRSGDDSADDSDDDSSDTHEDNGRRRHGNETAREHANERSRVALSASESEIEGLRNGTLKAVDDLGRTLEVEIENEHGTVKVEVKLDGHDAGGPPISGVKVVPAS